MSIIGHYLLLTAMFFHPKYPPIPFDTLTPLKLMHITPPPLPAYEYKSEYNSQYMVGLHLWEDRGISFNFSTPKTFLFKGNLLRGYDFSQFDSAFSRMRFVSKSSGVEGGYDLHYWRRGERYAYGGNMHIGIFEFRSDSVFIGFYTDIHAIQIGDSRNSSLYPTSSVSAKLILPATRHLINVFSSKFEYSFHHSNSDFKANYNLRWILPGGFLLAPGLTLTKPYKKHNILPTIEMQYYGTRNLFVKVRWGYRAGIPSIPFFDFVAAGLDSISDSEFAMKGEAVVEMKPVKEASIKLSGVYEHGEGRIFRKGNDVPYLYSAGGYRLFCPTLTLNWKMKHIEISASAYYTVFDEGVFFVPQYSASLHSVLRYKFLSLGIDGGYIGPTKTDEEHVREPYYIANGYVALRLPYNFHFKFGVENATGATAAVYGDRKLEGRKYLAQVIWLR